MKLLNLLWLFFLINNVTYTETKRPSYNILYINSYHSGFTWSDNIEKGFISELKNSNINYEIFFERLDSKRILLQKTKEEYINLFSTKYDKDFFDIVVTSDDNAFNFSINNRINFFPDVPIVFSGVNNNKNPHLADKNVAGVLEDINILGLIDLIKIVHPNVEHIAIIGDKTETSDLHIINTVEILQRNFPKLNYSIHNNWTLLSLEEELKKFTNNTIIIELAFHLDKNLKTISFEQELDFFKNKIQLPAYSLWDTRLGYGIIGGVVSSGEVHGQVAAKLTISILNGIFPENNIIENIPYPTYFDYEVIKRLNVPLKNIPKGAIIINKPDTLWFKYKSYIIIIIIFSIAQVILIIVLINNIKYKKIAQNRLILLNEKLEEKVKNRTKDLEDTLNNLKISQENLIESKKMASLGNLVNGVSHQINTPLGICKTVSSYLKDKIIDNSYNELKDSVTLLEDNVSKVASVINRFKETSIDFTTEHKSEFNIHQYISQILLSQENVLKTRNIKVNFICNEDLVVSTYTGVLFKIFLILIENSINHGFNKKITDPIIKIDVSKIKNSISIIFSDNGIGVDSKYFSKIFDPFFSSQLGRGSGLGLNIAYNEVVHRLNGSINVNQHYTKGLSIIINFPI